MARPSKEKAIERLQKALDEIPELNRLRYGSQEFQKWRRNTRTALSNVFGGKSIPIREFGTINYTTNIDPMAIALFSKDRTRTPDSISQKAYVKGLQSAASLLESMIEEIEEYWENGHQTPPSSAARENERVNTNEVFIIHGRDEGTKAMVARFLEQQDLEPVILDEQSNQGLTIIEKFERHAQVGFAVALLTPDDAGSLQGDESHSNPRARQNVIFELGFFIGKLGRKGVCVLTKGEVEIPSDYAGVVYIPLDDRGAWKMGLVRELKSAGYNVDANKAL